MPQEAWVVKCYSCKKFQVQLKKKAKKWKCVVCGSKQDLMTIFFTGQPCDCRVNVQNLNAAEGEKNEKLLAKIAHENEALDEYFNEDDFNDVDYYDDVHKDNFTEDDGYENEYNATEALAEPCQSLAEFDDEFSRNLDNDQFELRDQIESADYEMQKASEEEKIRLLEFDDEFSRNLDNDRFEVKDQIESADYEMQKAAEEDEIRFLELDAETMFGNPHEDIDEYLDF
ncbi:MRN complex-interacting protein [Trichogramma pretiosum]|uniref:MRN complex-interacting protein n=1 Tax=Trichogramma pretiosum TaxID=7493 RepID=UPI0006C98D17|nr:MRN complex-interacting protein [Trichogramma pretiosum]